MKNLVKPGKILCLDYGKVRVGLAVSDVSQTIAFPLKSLIDKTSIHNKLVLLKPIIVENAINNVVIGNPLLLNGSKSPLTKEVEIFAQLILEHLNIKVILWDERLSSMEADKILKQGRITRKNRTSKIDSIAATLILQSFLSALHSTNNG